MTRTQKIWLGILTVLPFVLFAFYFLFFFFIFLSVFKTASNGESPEIGASFISNFFALFALIGLISLLSLGLLIYYIIHAINNKVIDSNERIVWILVFVFAGIIGFPIYWYMRIWKTE